MADWRRGRIPCLEMVIQGNLSRLSRLLRILAFYAHDLNLKPSPTVYRRHGKGPRQVLRFTRSGDARIEAAYSPHFVRLGRKDPPEPDMCSGSTCAPAAQAG